MAALTAGRNTPKILEPRRQPPVKANAKLFVGGMVQIDATGFAVAGVATVANVTIGVAQETVDNTGGANGDKTVKTFRGVYRFNNSAAGDLIARTEIGKTVYVVDDNTVAKTNATNTRPAAGVCYDVDTLGVWVDFQV